MTSVPKIFKPHIVNEYPKNNKIIFEEWFEQRFKEIDNLSIYEYLPVFWTSYFVNNNYANDLLKVKELQDYIDGLDRSKKYFTVLQYDDGCIVDFKDLDIIIFGASGKDATDDIPLLCQPHPFLFDNERDIFASFVGSKTHPIREELFAIKNKVDYFISDTRIPINEYCKVLSRSIFGLAPRGYGINSFRIAEAVQYGAIPVYISDEFNNPSWMNFEDFGIIIRDEGGIENILNKISKDEIIKKREKLKDVYENYYTYESNYNLILNKINNIRYIHGNGYYKGLKIINNENRNSNGS